MKKGNKKLRLLIFQQRTLLVSLLLALIIIAGLIVSYFMCNNIAYKKGMSQLKDASNTVIDQISAKFDRDRNVLNAAAEIITSYDLIKEDGNYEINELKQTFRRLTPIRQTMQLRILLPDDKILLPNESIIYPDGSFEQPDGVIVPPTGILAKGSEFNFEEEKEHGSHISHRFDSLIFEEDREIEPSVALFVPIYAKPEQKGEIVAMLYGITTLSTLPSEMRLDNIYDGNASVMIFDVKNEYVIDGKKKHAVIMDTMHKDADLSNLYFEEFMSFKTKGGLSCEQVLNEIYSIKNLELGASNSVENVTQLWSESARQWLYFYYSSARNIVRNQWCIGISVPEKIAFGNVIAVRNVFLIIGSILLVAVILYFLWVRHEAKREVAKSVESALLEEKLHKAEAAEKAKTMFLSNMSHDIRTPMNAILGFTALAETNINNKEKVQDYLKKILSSGNHLLSLINDILDMSRIESGKLNIEEKPCSISDIFRDMRNIIQTQMKTKQLNFFMDTLDVIDEDIFCDKLHLNQVLLNLLSNSIKFTPVGGSVSLTIKQKSGAPTGYGAYEIRVKDTGIGMSEEFAKHIFEPFERERTSTVSGIQGTGLGMAITKNIIDAMGGTIEVLTEKGNGTEFIINLQFRLQTERRKLGTIRELMGLRALVVDDNFTTCDSLSKMLMTIGMHSEWTLYGKEAILRTQQAIDIGEPFAAYIIDWVMPDLSGFEIVRQIRKIVGDNIPIIIVTAYDVSAIMDEAKDVGVTAYCNKPIFFSDLRDTLISCIKTEDKEEDPKTDSPNEPQTNQFVGKRLLLVEDNELNREIAEEVLIENGFNVETAEDGEVAVKMVAKNDTGYYDLILMDVQMPKMNGYDATRAIRADEKGKSVPIVAMTANAFDEDRRKAIESGMNAHIAKPIDIGELIKVINNLLKSKDNNEEKS